HFPQGFSAVVISNHFHIFRAVSIARHLEIPAGHIGAYTDWYTLPVNYLREILAVVNWFLFGGQT
ncbi:MAG: hypothetical protein FWD01_05660, partial [Defluviitaleaceae bacterium]|nr:hypothetical protein [Defluviitaleaceae bacterium]